MSNSQPPLTKDVIESIRKAGEELSLSNKEEGRRVKAAFEILNLRTYEAWDSPPIEVSRRRFLCALDLLATVLKEEPKPKASLLPGYNPSSPKATIDRATDAIRAAESALR